MTARGLPREEVEAALATVESINSQIEKHARIGAVIFTETPWTIENDSDAHDEDSARADRSSLVRTPSGWLEREPKPAVS